MVFFFNVCLWCDYDFQIRLILSLIVLVSFMLKNVFFLEKTLKTIGNASFRFAFFLKKTDSSRRQRNVLLNFAAATAPLDVSLLYFLIPLLFTSSSKKFF